MNRTTYRQHEIHVGAGARYHPATGAFLGYRPSGYFFKPDNRELGIPIKVGDRLLDNAHDAEAFAVGRASLMIDGDL
jgi:hypothetical protein